MACDFKKTAFYTHKANAYGKYGNPHALQTVYIGPGHAQARQSPTVEEKRQAQSPTPS